MSLNELLDALEERRAGVVLLPNARAAQELRGAFDRRMRARGERAWDAPAVQSWGQWMGSLWSELVVSGAETRLMLNAAQEHSVWREIIAEDAGSAGFGQTDALAEMASSGWKLASAFEATGKLRGFASTHDSKVFVEWAEAFQRRCAAKGYVAAAQLEDVLRAHMERGSVPVSTKVELVGFGEQTPAQKSLLEAMRARGADMRERSLRGERGGLRAALVAASESEELEVVARWLRDFVERERGRVAVLLPGLAEERAEFEDVLRRVLTPELQAVGEDLSSMPWEFTDGETLGSVTMVTDAIAIVKWVDGTLPVPRVSALLLSPYLGGGEERDAVARFDADVLRRAPMLRPELGMAAVVGMDRAPRLGWLREVLTFLRRDGDRSKPRGYAEWMEFVRGVVTSSGWPGERALTASEFAATEAWERALDTVATLDFSGKRVSYETALQALEEQARTAAVHAAATGASVQVMGIAEAEGSVWDAVVMIRATDANWPAAERVHPLLPWGLQRSLKMPGSDPALAAARAREFTAGILARAGDVLFTSAAEDSDGKLRASPLGAEFALERVAAASLAGEAKVEEFVTLEAVEDGVALPPLPSGRVRGGAAVLKFQAACGFLAFAEMRLRAKELETDEVGLSAGGSGSWLHGALQRFWNRAKTQATLRAMSWAERDAAILQAIEEAMPRRVRAESAWDAAYVGVQTERLRVVLQQWLGEELKRGPFEILESERQEQITVGPLTMDVRFDRIDKVGDGYFLVDYKTGLSGHPKEWEGDRPDDPQLPLYALQAEDGELKGLAFARVRAGDEMKWVGVQTEAGILPKSSANKTVELPALVAQWRATLAELAESFAAGDAGVRPKSYAVNCVRCGQRLLCRVRASSLVEDLDEAEDLDG